VISEFFISVWVDFVGWIAGLIPTFDESVQNVGLMSMLAPVAVGAGGLGAWIPWLILAVEAPLVIGMYVLSLVLRAIKSLIPTISG
jgi:hypothetical protein